MKVNKSIYFIPEAKKKAEAAKYFYLTYEKREEIVELLKRELNSDSVEVIWCEATHYAKDHNKIYKDFEAGDIPLKAKGWLRLLDVCLGVDAIAVSNGKYYPVDFKHTPTTVIRHSRIYGTKEDLSAIKEYFNKFVSKYKNSSLKDIKLALNDAYNLFEMVYNIKVLESSNTDKLDWNKINNDMYFDMLKMLETDFIKINTMNLKVDTDASGDKYDVSVYDNEFKDGRGSISVMIKM